MTVVGSFQTVCVGGVPYSNSHTAYLYELIHTGLLIRVKTQQLRYSSFH